MSIHIDCNVNTVSIYIDMAQPVGFMADAAEQLLQIHADAGVGVFCIAHICFNYRQTLLTHCHKLMPMLGSVFSALLTFVSIKICAE